MATYSLSAGGHSWSQTVTDSAQIAALQAILAERNDERAALTEPLPPRDEAGYINHVLADVVTGNPGITLAELQETTLRALTSWAGQVPPEIIADVPEPTPDALMAYAADKRRAIVNAGATVDVAGTMIPIWTDAGAQAALTGAVVAAQVLGEAFATLWKGSDGQFYSQTATSIVALALGAMKHVNGAFAREAAAIEAIKATPPTITKKSDVDAHFA